MTHPHYGLELGSSESQPVLKAVPFPPRAYLRQWRLAD